MPDRLDVDRSVREPVDLSAQLVDLFRGRLARLVVGADPEGHSLRLCVLGFGSTTGTASRSGNEEQGQDRHVSTAAPHDLCPLLELLTIYDTIAPRPDRAKSVQVAGSAGFGETAAGARCPHPRNLHSGFEEACRQGSSQTIRETCSSSRTVSVKSEHSTTFRDQFPTLTGWQLGRSVLRWSAGIVRADQQRRQLQTPGSFEAMAPDAFGAQIETTLFGPVKVRAAPPRRRLRARRAQPSPSTSGAAWSASALAISARPASASTDAGAALLLKPQA